RNAVIGKAHRLGLKARPSPVKPNDPKEKGKAKKEVEAPAKTVAKVKAKAPAPKAAPAPDPSSDDDTPRQPIPNPTPDMPKIVSVGPGGFLRQGPGDQQAPIPPAPPRRLVPAKPS